jgi:hypothetical protein
MRLLTAISSEDPAEVTALRGKEEGLLVELEGQESVSAHPPT